MPDLMLMRVSRLASTVPGSSERTEDQWKALIEDPEVGLKFNGIWEYSQYDQMVIEAELV